MIVLETATCPAPCGQRIPTRVRLDAHEALGVTASGRWPTICTTCRREYTASVEA